MSRLTDTIKQNTPQRQFLRRSIDLRPVWHQLRSLWHQFGLLPIVALTALLAPFVPSPPSSVQRHGAQTVCVEAGAALLLAALLCRPWPLSSLRLSFLRLSFLRLSFLRLSFQAAPLARLTFLFLALLLFWGLISCVLAPTAFAIQGLLLLGVGVLVAGVTAAQVISTRRAVLAAACVVLPALLVAFLGLIQMRNGSNPLIVGVLKDHQLFGAFLLIPIPLCLALSLAPGPLTQRLTGQAALLICAAGLRESQNRSAWLGTGVSLAVFAGLLCYLYAADHRDAGSKSRERRRRERRRRERKSYDRRNRASVPELPELRTSRANAIVPALLGLVALIGFVLISPSLDARFARMRPAAPVMHGSDESLRWRKIVWLGTRRMIAEKPLAGWGIGSFPVRHEPFTHTGDPADRVSVRGPSIEDEAHDSYLQVWAELGIVGLLLWLGAFFSLIGSGMQSLRHLRRGSVKQWILIGGLSAVIGQMTDALANPAWQFGSVLLPLWIVFGLTSALSAPHRADQPPPARPLLWRIAQYILAAGLGLWLLSLIWRTAFALPAPHL